MIKFLLLFLLSASKSVFDSNTSPRGANLLVVFFFFFEIMFFTPIMFNCLFKYMKYAIIVCVNLVCYYQSIEGEFVFDDSVAIVKNRDVNNGEINSETLKVISIN